MLDTPTAPRAGLIESAVQKLFTRSAQVLDVEPVSDSFLVVTLGGAGLRDAAWTPGDKIQIQLGGWVQRTYTPMDWDTGSGPMRFLVHLHAAGGPGVQWAQTLRKGDTCVFFGPRKSIRLARVPSSVIVFGDETSLGLAVALTDQVYPSPVRSVFEVSGLADAARVVERLRLEGAHLCVRRADDGHFGELAEHMSALIAANPTAEIVLTGRGAAIQRLGKLAPLRGAAAARRQNKAYWAAGKTGLD